MRIVCEDWASSISFLCCDARRRKTEILERADGGNEARKGSMLTWLAILNTYTGEALRVQQPTNEARTPVHRRAKPGATLH